MARTRVAIIGLGMAVAPHALSLSDLADRVEVAAGYSPTPARRAQFASTYGLPVSGDLDKLFDDPSIAAVFILTPPNTHLDLVRRAVATGKHILLEKPLEISRERSATLVDIAGEGGVRLGVVLQHRFKPNAVALRDLIEADRLGSAISASVCIRNWRPQSYYDQPGRGTKARDGGGVLLTQGIHTLDLLVSLAGLPEAVAGVAATSLVHAMETEDVAAAVLRFAGGAIGTVQATTAAWPGFADRIEIVGARGTAEIVGEALTARFHDGGTVDTGAEQTGGAGADPMNFSHHHHRALIADFIEAIEQDREPAVSGREALKAHQLIDAILRASDSGRWESV